MLAGSILGQYLQDLTMKIDVHETIKRGQEGKAHLPLLISLDGQLNLVLEHFGSAMETKTGHSQAGAIAKAG